MKKLSLNLPSAQSSAQSLQLIDPPPSARPRRPSIASLPAASLMHRRDEEPDSPGVPYVDGPVQVIPGIWIGSEDNARDWKGLIERGIRSILNVAKEVSSPFDAPQPLRPAMSTPNLKLRGQSDPTYYPAHIQSGRPAMHYLKLQWSHGQQDLVNNGFKAGINFVDAALERGEGCLIHCQCGISRSATMVIALVMRAASERLSSVPPEVWALQGMQPAYDFVKEKSSCIGPNMSLIYQLLEYEKALRRDKGQSPHDSDSSSIAEDEEEWTRRRRLLDEVPTPEEDDDREISLVMQEAKALDKAMEDRVVARKASASSVTSVSSVGSGSGIGMGAAWRIRYARKRTGSSSSNNSSFLSENLLEEEEEQDLLGVGSSSDNDYYAKEDNSSSSPSPDDEHKGTPRNLSSMATAVPPSAPVWKTSFETSPPPPQTAVRSTFELPRVLSKPKPKAPKRRPLSLSILPPVPSSPVNIVLESDTNQHQRSSTRQQPVADTQPRPSQSLPRLPLSLSNLSLPPALRQRAESRRLPPPPLHLRQSVLLRKSSTSSTESAMTQSLTVPIGSGSGVGTATPSQTLFVFPPSPTLSNTRTPSTMTLLSNPGGAVPFPSLTTPRVSTFSMSSGSGGTSKGAKRRSFIGLASPPTPTVGLAKVDARGYFGMDA
ncbi:hypothetical protein CPB83DRAFT_830744 [Crepidotus variabilis]|uniref:protein-tyrosine-phosphatase n=1 Tax=Crepidotus variabilis TaxID=179855 RepID=A0A9P6EUM7_9AGAR|nr:hypothetical protein CPB83DRAFT_830744 [Crepidotus variabilis]